MRKRDSKRDNIVMRVLDEKELDQVAGGKLTSENPGGQPHGASQITYSEGTAPPGQNKDLPPGIQKQI
jgi:hypothetical protein